MTVGVNVEVLDVLLVTDYEIPVRVEFKVAAVSPNMSSIFMLGK